MKFYLTFCLAYLLLFPYVNSKPEISQPEQNKYIKNLPNNGCSTINYVSSKNLLLEFGKEIPKTVTTENFMLKSDTPKLQAYFDHEHSEDELKRSFQFILKFQDFCTINIFSENEFSEQNLAFLLWNKLTRPQFDYFVDPTEPQSVDSRFAGKFGKILTYKVEPCGSSGIDIQTCETKYFYVNNVGKDLIRNRQFKIAVTYAAHFISFTREQNGAIEGRGVEYEMVETLAKAYNFTYTMEYSTGKGTGAKMPNGTWTGTAGDVFNGLADFGVSLGTSRSRQAVIDATTVFEYTRLPFLNRKPTPEPKWQSLFASFDWTAWLGTSIAALMTAAAIFIIFCLNEPMEIAYSIMKENISFATNFVFRALLEQSCQFSSKLAKQVHFILIIWMFGSLLIGTAFKSKLVSFLTFPYSDKIPETFQELADAPKYNICFKYYGGVAYTAFKTSRIPVQRALFPRLVVENNLQKCIEAVVLKDKTVCVVYNEAASYMIAANYTLKSTSKIEYLGKAKEFGLIVPLVWAFPKGSPLMPIFSDLIGAIKSAGLYDYWMKTDLILQKIHSAKWLSKGGRSNLAARKLRDFYVSLEKTVKPLIVKHFIGPYLLLLTGVTAAVITFLLEIFPSYLLFFKSILKKFQPLFMHLNT